MADKYAVTLVIGCIEVFLSVKPFRWIGTLEEVREFVSENKDSYLTLHTYLLTPIEGQKLDTRSGVGV